MTTKVLLASQAHWVTRGLVAALVGAVGALSVATPSQAVSLACEASYVAISAWNSPSPGGFQGELTVTNIGTAPMSSWTVATQFESGVVIQNYWSSRLVAGLGTPWPTFANISLNGALGLGQQTSFGIIAKQSPSYPGSVSPFYLNCLAN